MELYYQHPMLSECSAIVLDCIKCDNAFAIVLDRTVIFPESGGQLSDTGFIDESEVLRAGIVDGRILHYCDAPFEIGMTVTVRLDIPARLDHTAQHTGEHILSGLAFKLFGAHNVGFHMAKDYCTIDLDRFLDEAELIRLQLAANAAVQADLPITFQTVSGTEAGALPLRKLADKLSDTTEDVRIVYIDGGSIDSCTCCGTHFASTGSVGAILITDAQKYKGGIRLFFSCHERAIRHSIDEHRILTSLARRFSTSAAELPTAVSKLQSDLSSARQEIKSKSLLISELLACTLLSDARLVNSTLCIVKLFDSLTASDLKPLSDRLLEKSESPLVALLFCKGAGGTEYRMVCSPGVKLSMRDLCSAVNAALDGKGGGSPTFAQGKSSRSVTSDELVMLENYIASVLKA